MEVCRMRNSPIITFINKCDREGKDPISLLDEIEEKLQIQVCPMTWPIGSGSRFKGVYSFVDQSILLFTPHKTQTDEHAVLISDIDSAEAKAVIDEADLKTLKDDIELISGVYPSLDHADYLNATVTPVFLVAL